MKYRNKTLISFLLMLMIFVLAMPVSASAAKISKKKATLKVGKTLQLQVTGTTETVKWSSTKKSVATVTQDGLVKAKKRGTATIKAKVGTKTYKCKITVKQPVKSITLNKTSYFLMPGKTLKLSATVLPSNANNKKVTWTSSNKSVATVTSGGTVKAIAKGNATITAKAKDGSGKKAICKIIVLQGSTTSTSTTTSTGTSSTTTTSGSTAKRFLAVLEKYSKRIQSDKKNGINWYYNRSSVPKTFEDAIANNKLYTTCSWMITWALKDSTVGVLNYKNIIATKDDAGGEIWYNSTDCKTNISNKATVIRTNTSLLNLAKEGKLQPGDICVYNAHMNVFVSYDKSSGTGKFYDSGRNSIGGSYSNGTYYFKTFGPLTMSMNSHCYYIIRLK